MHVMGYGAAIKIVRTPVIVKGAMFARFKCRPFGGSGLLFLNRSLSPVGLRFVLAAQTQNYATV